MFESRTAAKKETGGSIPHQTTIDRSFSRKVGIPDWSDLWHDEI